MTARYEVHALRYATLESSRSATFLGGDAQDGPLQMDYYVWAIVGTDRTVVVDTGFSRHMAERRKRNWLRCPTAALHSIGIDAATVSDVVITHLHYDHAGNIDKFPNARIHVQEREVSFATGRHMCNSHNAFSGLIEQDDVLELVRTVFARRVVFHDGDAEVAPGVTLHRVGGHTPGMQVVRVWTDRGWLVLASDATHLYANINEGRPFHVFVDLVQMIDGWRIVRRLATHPDNIIPGHDPEVMLQYPASSPSATGIAARVDLPSRSTLVVEAMNY